MNQNKVLKNICPTMCPFCDRRFPKTKKLCLCGAYRVNGENKETQLKEREDIPIELKNKIKKRRHKKWLMM